MRRIALAAAVGLLLAGCGGDERTLRIDRTLPGRVDEPRPTPKPDWPEAETSFCDRRVGFGRSQPTGGFSLVSATTDGGRTWAQRARVQVGAGTLTCLSRNDVVLSAYPPLGSAGSGPLLLRSADGGRRWTAIAMPVGASSPPAVAGPETYLVPQTATSWLATRNGGRSWRRIAPSRRDPLEALTFLSPEVAYAVTSHGEPETGTTTLLRSEDAARSWTPVLNRIDGLRMHALTSADGMLWVHGLRCTGGSCRSVLVRTDDDGRHWDLIELPELPADLRFTSTTRGVASAPGGFYVTRDGGVTWTWHAPR